MNASEYKPLQFNDAKTLGVSMPYSPLSIYSEKEQKSSPQELSP